MKQLSLAVLLAGLLSVCPWALAQAPEAEDKAAPAAAGSAEPDKGIKGLLNADSQNNDPYFRDVAKELRCPTCTGLSVLESDASFSVQIKDQVQEQIKLGKSKEDIVKYFVERYGPWILREPPKEGFNLLAWAVPIALLIFGPILIWLLIWRRKVQFNAHGVRSTEALIKEMHDRLLLMKERKE